MTGHRPVVTDVTAFPTTHTLGAFRGTGIAVTSVTPADPDRLFPELGQLAFYLGSEAWEAAWTGRLEADVIAERATWVRSGVSQASFSKRWKSVNVLSASAMGRLTGFNPAAVRRCFVTDSRYSTVDPLTGRAYLSLRKMHDLGHPIWMLKLAMRAENFRDVDLPNALSEYR